MMEAEAFFSRLWDEYVKIAPSAGRIHALISERYGQVTNDHVAFRTFDFSPIGIEVLERPFLDWGYTRDRPYAFPDKHLRAFGYVPRRAGLPLVFLSELVTSELPTDQSDALRRAVEATDLSGSPAELLLGGRPWLQPTESEYSALEAVSPYAAWLSVWGLCANHFTVAVHHLPGSIHLRDLVETVRAAGYELNEVGGLIKGSPEELLEQASTLAESSLVEFSDGTRRTVPSCYYEFAERHRDESGEYYLGFVAASANNIFESTTKKRGSRSDTVEHSG